MNRPPPNLPPFPYPPLFRSRGFSARAIGSPAGRQDQRRTKMPKRTDIKSILIIGAGPIIIGQACEFDYSGTDDQDGRSEEHTSELQSRQYLVCRLLLEKKTI